MASEETSLSSAFPPPPRAFELFTHENVRKYKEDATQMTAEVREAMKLPELPQGPYMIYGETWLLKENLPSLSDANITQLYLDDCNIVHELNKLARSLLLNFLELVTIMSSAPEQFPPKLEHIRTIMLNMHRLINEFRPHQTRESLISMMEQQLAQRTTEAEQSEAVIQETRHLLAQYQDITLPDLPTSPVTNGHSLSEAPKPEASEDSIDVQLFTLVNDD